MSIYNNLQKIKKLTNSSLTSIIDITNLNFNILSKANLDFLENINYNELTNSFNLFKGTFNIIDVNNLFRVISDGNPIFTIDSQGRAEGREILSRVIEAKRYRHTDFPDWPDEGIPGEIIYTGINNSRPEFGEDFIGYLQGRGWVSLTRLNENNDFLSLFELQGSPPIPPTTQLNQGILWIGAPGYETDYSVSTQTLYFTDENGKTYDIISDFIWLKLGNDAKFKLNGKIIIGDLINLGQLQYIDGNQEEGYVLTSDEYGNATWRPPIGSPNSSNSSFVIIESFLQNTPKTIIHNLGTKNIHVQLIDLTNNELIEAQITNYQVNSIDITFSIDISNIKVIILAAGSNSSSSNSQLEVLENNNTILTNVTKLNFIGDNIEVNTYSPSNDQVNISINQKIGLKKVIDSSEVITVEENYQYFIYGDLLIKGEFNNYGEVIIANGNLILDGGQFNNLGQGILKLINLATGESIRVVIKNFTAIAFSPIFINHNLGTKDFIYSIRDGDYSIPENIEHIDENTIKITFKQNINSGVITFHAKIN